MKMKWTRWKKKQQFYVGTKLTRKQKIILFCKSITTMTIKKNLLCDVFESRYHRCDTQKSIDQFKFALFLFQWNILSIDRQFFKSFFFHFFLSPLTILFAIHAYTVHTRTHIYYDRANRSVISFELCYTLKMIIITFTFAILNENVSFYLCVHVYACMLAMTMSPISNIITCMHEHAYILARRIFECQIRN